ncbi:MAG TPA: hypothetical protein VFU49_12450 [Ktedonobacteraceae bacterium]|nr:hypothetical protein [Ktedonobacteraceae bacterium]
MLVRITVNVLRIAALLALILGLIFWTSDTRGTLVPIHMLLGIIVTLALLILGGVIMTVKGGLGIGIAAIVLAIVVPIIGLTQTQLLGGSLHWIIQVIHLLIGLAAIGMGEMIAGRYRRTMTAKIAQ